MLVQDWILHKSYNPIRVLISDGQINGSLIEDFNYTAKEFRVIGTQNQLDKAINGEWTLKIKEFYDYTVLPKEYFWWGNEVERKEYNKKVKENLKFYKRIYKENKNKLLILRIN